MRPCPVPGCTNQVGSSRVLMCRRCWNRVPKDVQARCYAAWRSYRKMQTLEKWDEYIAVRQTTIAAALVGTQREVTQ